MRAVYGYICDTCGRFIESIGSKEDRPWACPVCNKETCSYCFSRYAVCDKCATTMTDEQCLEAATKAGWDFDE